MFLENSKNCYHSGIFFKNESAPKCEFPSLIFSVKVPLFKEILERRSFFSKLDVQCSIFNRVV